MQRRRNLIEFKSENLIAICALVVSILAIYQSCQQFKETSALNKEQLEIQRNHNKLSVKPQLVFEENVSNTYSDIGISLKNKGLGPAIIISNDIYFNGIKVSSWQELTDSIISNDLIFWKHTEPEWFSFDKITLLPGEEIKLYNLKRDNLLNIDQAVRVLDKIQVKFKYTNFYSDTFNIYLRNHN